MSTNPLAALIVTDVCGPFFFAVVLFTGIYGVTCMQTFYYFVHYPNDPRSLKIFVAVVWALETNDLALTISGVYKYIMGGLENPASLMLDVPELVTQGLAGTMASLPTQAFLVYRIYVLSGKNLAAPILWLIPALYQIASGIVCVVKAFYSSNGSLHVIPVTAFSNQFFATFTEADLVVSAAIDAAIAITMIILLSRQRATAGFASTLHIVQLLTIFAVNTGLWTAVFSILSVILLHTYRGSLLYLVFSIPLSSVYTNALLANLNGRSYIRQQGMNKQDSAGAEIIVGPLVCARGDTTTEKEGTGLSSRILVDIRKTTVTETVAFGDTDLSTEHNAGNMV